MRIVYPLTAIALAAVMLALPNALAQEGPTEVSGCTSLDAAGAYVLTQDIDAAGADPCLRIPVSGVHLDGAGFAVANAGTAIEVGMEPMIMEAIMDPISFEEISPKIVTPNPTSDFTVSDLGIQEGSIGIRLTDAADVLLSDIRIFEMETGIEVLDNGATTDTRIVNSTFEVVEEAVSQSSTGTTIGSPTIFLGNTSIEGVAGLVASTATNVTMQGNVVDASTPVSGSAGAAWFVDNTLTSSSGPVAQFVVDGTLLATDNLFEQGPVFFEADHLDLHQNTYGRSAFLMGRTIETTGETVLGETLHIGGEIGAEDVKISGLASQMASITADVVDIQAAEVQSLAVHELVEFTMSDSNVQDTFARGGLETNAQVELHDNRLGTVNGAVAASFLFYNNTAESVMVDDVGTFQITDNTLQLDSFSSADMAVVVGGSGDADSLVAQNMIDLGDVGGLAIIMETATGRIAENTITSAGSGVGIIVEISDVQVVDNTILTSHDEFFGAWSFSGSGMFRGNIISGAKVGIVVAETLPDVVGNDLGGNEVAIRLDTIVTDALPFVCNDLSAPVALESVDSLFTQVDFVSGSDVAIGANYFGPRGPLATQFSLGDVAFAPWPFLSAAPEVGTDCEDTQALAYQSFLPAGGIYPLGTPAPLEHDLATVLGEFDGVAWLFDEDAQQWRMATGDERLGAMDGVVVQTATDVHAVLDFQDSPVAQATERSFVKGWNFAAPRHLSDAWDAFTSFGLDGEPTVPVVEVHDLFDTHADPFDHLNDAFMVTSVGSEMPSIVSPMRAFFVYTDDAGDLPGKVPIGARAAHLHLLVNEESLMVL